jgi:hypothetical protein
VDGQLLSWEYFGSMLKRYLGWSFQLRLGGALCRAECSSAVEAIEGRSPTVAPPPVVARKLALQQRAAARALCKTAGAFVLDSAHYPTPEEWARGHAG